MTASNLDKLLASSKVKVTENQTIMGREDPNMSNQELIELNELNVNSNGGTELTTRKLYDVLSRADLDGIQIITSRVRELDPDRLKILHLHDLPLDPESEHLKDPALRARFNKLVFSSNWQYQQFRDYLGVPYSNHSAVIETGIEPLVMTHKPMDKVRLIYTSTPHRGLEILVPVFVELAKKYPNIELDVFSSFGIYGWEDRDKPFEPLFDICRSHPQINYHGWQPNDIVRAAYEGAHIFSYPNIWPETSCRSLIEAMSAGCLCVHPNFAALPETSGGLTIMYGGDQDMNVHANIFAHTLDYAINNIINNELTGLLSYVKSYVDTKHSWETVGVKWKGLINSVKMDSI